MPDTNPLSAALDLYRTVHREILYRGERVCDSDHHRWPCDASKALDAIDAALRHHPRIVSVGYCETCARPYPCPEVRDIITALTGEAGG